MSKLGPNLRDFRIDAKEVPEESITSRQSPRQQVTTRGAVSKAPQSSVQEWGSPSWQGQERGDLWQMWEEDEEFHREQSAAGTSKAAPPSTAAVPTPAPNKVTKGAEKSSASPQNPEVKASDAETVYASPGQGLLAWSAELALEERRMERLGVVDFSNSFKKADLLKRLTREFMKKLRENFQREIEVFNSVRQSQSHFIHLYRVSNTEEDFMLFRNGVKLVVSGERSGHVLLAFNQYMGQIFTPSQQQPSFELDASWGAFDQIHWNYRGERVSVQDIVRYFLGEFSKQSYK